MSKLEELCTIKQACFSEQAGRTTVYKRINEGHYIAVKIGGSTRLKVASILAYRRLIEVKSCQGAGLDNDKSIATILPGNVRLNGQSS